MSATILDNHMDLVMDTATRPNVAEEAFPFTRPQPLRWEWPEPKQTLVVNLFGGPGTGKSTTAALVFGALKVAGIKAELVHEFAKQLTWEGRSEALSWQPYIFGKQSYAIQRLIGKTDVIITDSPILLSSHIYSQEDAGYNKEDLEYLGESVYKAWNTLSVFLQRDLDLHPFVQAGRNQDEAESIEIDGRIKSMLQWAQINYTTIGVASAAEEITRRVEQELSR